MTIPAAKGDKVFVIATKQGADFQDDANKGASRTVGGEIGVLDGMNSRGRPGSILGHLILFLARPVDEHSTLLW